MPHPPPAGFGFPRATWPRSSVLSSCSTCSSCEVNEQSHIPTLLDNSLLATGTSVLGTLRAGLPAHSGQGETTTYGYFPRIFSEPTTMVEALSPPSFQPSTIKTDMHQGKRKKPGDEDQYPPSEWGRSIADKPAEKVSFCLRSMGSSPQRPRLERRNARAYTLGRLRPTPRQQPQVVSSGLGSITPPPQTSSLTSERFQPRDTQTQIPSSPGMEVEPQNHEGSLGLPSQAVQIPASPSTATLPPDHPVPPSPPLSAYLQGMHLSPRNRATSEPRESAHPHSSTHPSRPRELMRSRSDSPTADLPTPTSIPSSTKTKRTGRDGLVLAERSTTSRGGCLRN